MFYFSKQKRVEIYLFILLPNIQIHHPWKTNKQKLKWTLVMEEHGCRQILSKQYHRIYLISQTNKIIPFNRTHYILWFKVIELLIQKLRVQLTIGKKKDSFDATYITNVRIPKNKKYNSLQCPMHACQIRHRQQQRKKNYLFQTIEMIQPFPWASASDSDANV